MAVDIALANISDHLYSGALVGYSAGIMLLCGDFAFGKSGRKKEAKEAADLAAEAKQPAMVGASPGSVLEPPVGTDDVSGSTADPQSTGGTDRTARIGAKLGLFGVVFTLLGLIAQIASATLRGIAIGRLP